MERDLWPILSAHLTRLARITRRHRYLHSTARILRVYLWAVLHDRPVSWACDKRNWPGIKPPGSLPNQSTMSRRLRRADTRAMLERMLDQLQPIDYQAMVLRLDGKALPIAKHSQDAKATIGRGSGGFQKGYKLHAIYGCNNRPVAFCIAPMNVDERTAAKEMIARLPHSEGYMLADKNYESNPLYEQVHAAGRIYVTPRRFKNAKGVGQTIKHSPHRLEMIDRMKRPSPYIRQVLANRSQIETCFALLSNYSCGLTHLPPWVRGSRVEMYVTAKILIRLARDQLIKRKNSA